MNEIPKIPEKGKAYLGDEKLVERYVSYRVGRLVNPPPWWPTFVPPQFSEEELLEIERFCQKIVDNIAKSGERLTPLERWRATRNFEELDRPFLASATFNNITAKALDCFSGSLKPGIDLYWYPKLCLKGHLAWAAAFAPDDVAPYNFSYGLDAEFGGRSKSKLVPYAAPAWVTPPIDLAHLEEDLARIHTPDVYRDGFFPPHLWLVRKLKEFMMKYGAYDVMPIHASFCAMPEAGGIIAGMKEGIKLNKTNPDLYERLAKVVLPYTISLGRAIWDILDPNHDLGWCCDFPSFGILNEATKRALKYAAIVVKALPEFLTVNGFDQSAVLEYMCQNGMVSLGSIEYETPLETVKKIYTKYGKLYGMCSNEQQSAMATASVEKNVELTKANIDTGAGPGYYFVAGTVDVWSKYENVKAVIETAREHGKKKYEDLKSKPGALSSKE